jgi:hypothetical protein
MNRHAAIDLDWGDGTFTFRLALDQIDELERKRDLSLFEIARRLDPARRDARLSDISEVLRLGLIGGGMKPVDALAKVRKYVDERPIDENRDAAYAVVLAGMMRLHSNEAETPPGETEAAKTSVSTSPPSTETQP